MKFVKIGIRNVLSALGYDIRKRKVAPTGFINLSEWGLQDPDSYISSYDNIVCKDSFKTLSEELHREGKVLLSVREMWNIFNWVEKTAHLNGAIAEVGVYKGGSAKLIAQIKGNKNLYLFDTFEGIPKTDLAIDLVQPGSIAGDTLDQVRDYLRSYKNIQFFQGIFPESGSNITVLEEQFSFVHLDVDVYSSTLDCLEFFYSKMIPGGVIMTHDYRCKNTPGVKKAFDEFFFSKPETIIELWDTQAMIVKLNQSSQVSI